MDKIQTLLQNLSDDMKTGIATGLVIGITLTTTLFLLFNFIGNSSKVGRINDSIQMESDKVVNKVSTGEIEDMKAYCRCWKSKKFPLCDGSHTKQ